MSRNAGLALALAVGLATSAGFPPEARAAGLFRDLTPRDRAHPMVLSEAGASIPLRSASHPAAQISAGTVPAYLAFPLLGGEHIPAGIPTLATNPQPGQSVGPMDLTPANVAGLNADLLASRFAIVNTPGQSFAVAFLPRYARALEHSGASAGTGTSAGSTTTIASLGLPTSINQWTIQGIPGSQLSKWVKTGSSEIAHLSTLGINGVAKTLGLAGVKVTPTPTGLNFAPQYLVPSSVSSTATGPLPVPAPEPAAWLMFGLILGGAALRHKAARRK
jgi:hypothetical protein